MGKEDPCIGQWEEHERVKAARQVVSKGGRTPHHGDAVQGLGLGQGSPPVYVCGVDGHRKGAGPQGVRERGCEEGESGRVSVT